VLLTWNPAEDTQRARNNEDEIQLIPLQPYSDRRQGNRNQKEKQLVVLQHLAGCLQLSLVRHLRSVGAVQLTYRMKR